MTKQCYVVRYPEAHNIRIKRKKKKLVGTKFQVQAQIHAHICAFAPHGKDTKPEESPKEGTGD